MAPREWHLDSGSHCKALPGRAASESTVSADPSDPEPLRALSLSEVRRGVVPRGALASGLPPEAWRHDAAGGAPDFFLAVTSQGSRLLLAKALASGGGGRLKGGRLFLFDCNSHDLDLIVQ